MRGWVEHGLSDPPSYVVREVLVVHCGLEDIGRSDKVSWSCFLHFKGFTFEVRDWKRATWTVEASSETSEAKKAGQLLIRRIQSAAKIADKLFNENAKRSLQEGRFYALNVYDKLHKPYLFFRELARTRRNRSRSIDRTNRWLRSNIERDYCGQAAVGFYFSKLEHFETLAYPLLGESISFTKFRTMKWRERFAATFPISEDNLLKAIYERLLAVKQDVRDEVFHGYGGDEHVLIPTQRGLIPMSYTHLHSAVHYSEPALTGPIAATSAFKVFDDLDAWIKKHPPFSGILMLAESGLAIPFFGDRLAKMRSLLCHLKELDEWIGNEVALQDAFRNMDL